MTGHFVLMGMSVYVSAGGGMLGLSSVEPGSDGQWTVTQISCHSGICLSYFQHFSVLFCPSLTLFPLAPLSTLWCLKKTTHNSWNTNALVRNELELWPWSSFPFSLLSVRSSDWFGLFSFWWMSPGNLLWRWNGELFLSLFLVHSYCSCWCMLTHKSTFHPLGLCYSWHGYEYDWFCYLNLLKTPSSQHIILSHRCPSFLESADCGSVSSDSAAWFTSGAYLNTCACCCTQTGNIWVVCTAL